MIAHRHSEISLCFLNLFFRSSHRFPCVDLVLPHLFTTEVLNYRESASRSLVSTGAGRGTLEFLLEFRSVAENRHYVRLTHAGCRKKRAAVESEPTGRIRSTLVHDFGRDIPAKVVRRTTVDATI